ncbi:MAG: hypothetical protein GY765_21140 [bacterium]|nr:hypothetical protein [bacterium]
MRKKFVFFYFICCLVVLGVGVGELHSGHAVGIQIAKCDTAFNNRCTQPAQCSYNVSMGSGDCIIDCMTMADFNGKDKEYPSQAKCGTWKDAGTSGGGGAGGAGGIISIGIPKDASGEPADWWTVFS